MSDFNDFEVMVHESRGILDVDIEYLWEITEININDVIFKGDYKGSTMSELPPREREDVPSNHHSLMMEIIFNVGADLDLNTRLKSSFWINELRYNEENPEFTSVLISFIRKLGHSLELKDGTSIKPSDFFNVGTKFKAHVIPQKSKDGKETGFHELDITTVKPIEGDAPTEQGVITDVVSDEIKHQIIDFAKNYKDKNEAMTAMVKVVGLSHHVGTFISMCNSGEIKF